jgi:hypothetical protein
MPTAVPDLPRARRAVRRSLAELPRLGRALGGSGGALVVPPWGLVEVHEALRGSARVAGRVVRPYGTPVELEVEP